MIRVIAGVVRGEGARSAIRRAGERLGEALHRPFANSSRASILNVSATRVVPRLGGVPIQFLDRLRAERERRDVVLVEAGIDTFERRIREALASAGARAIHIEGTSEVPLDAALRLIDSGVPTIVTVHDFTLFDAPREVARRFLQAASAVVFPSAFIAEEHRRRLELPRLEAEIIEPGVPLMRHDPRKGRPKERSIAFAGSVKRHKGAHLLPEIAGTKLCHVFGGGDEELLRTLRRLRNFRVHGYHRAGTLPSLLAEYSVGLVVLPSIVPESFSLALSETWRAGAVAVAFDRGAIAQRIARHGGGWLAPVASGAAGLAELVRRWQEGQLHAAAPTAIATPEDAASAHLALYDRAGYGPQR